MDDISNNQDPAPLAYLAGGGEMGRRIRDFDWSNTPLGPVDGWPQSLRSALSICLNSNFPIAIYWGSDLVLLYNDEWSPIPGEKHPWTLGRPAGEAWPEIWHIIEPLFQQVMTTGDAIRSRDQLLPMHRHGYTEECYFDYTFSPIRGQRGQVEGIFNAVLETTTRVIGERRLRSLREMGSWKTGDAYSAEQACQTAAHVIAENPHDLPFALLYLLDAEGRWATLAGQTGVERDAPASTVTVELAASEAPWPFRRVAETGQAVEVNDLPATLGQLSGGAWPEPSKRAVVLPLAKSGQAQLAGFLVAGVSPRLPLNDDYRGFLDLLSGHVAAAVASARAYEQERRRAEALAELDRAKTTFFGNVSHEFRTPLTLMLGPVEDMLTKPAEQMRPEDRVSLEVVHRNGLRLQRLVNSLLDFSRIEAGRVRALFEPTNLGESTADLASNFRSACEKAGLRLTVDCPALAEPVFVDRPMWEKVVLNLLSNAFKFTFEGEIAVSLRQVDYAAEFRVRDTGTGIPAEEMPRLFERFHRVENARGRTHEGSGIGLALVQELVKLHGGSITAESEVGRGTTFIVTVPLGPHHLPREQVGSGRKTAPPTAAASPYVEEALRWLPDAQQRPDPGTEWPSLYDDMPGPVPSPQRPDADRPRVLVADDNADMRRYVERLLAGQYTVEAVPDGVAALDSVRRQAPDLILSDVMMPRLDGFGLLRQLRGDPRTASVPVVLLSARAGEESRVEGMEAGADDYLVKPFSARELLARVGALLQITRLRRESEQAIRQSEERFRVLFETMTEGFAIDEIIFDDAGRGCDLRYLEVNPAFERHTGLKRADIVGRTTLEMFPDAESVWFEQFGEVAKTGAPAHFQGKFGPLDRWFEVSAYRTGPNQVATVFFDITEQKRGEERERQLLVAAAMANAQFRAFFEQGALFAGIMHTDGRVVETNRLALEACGYAREQAVGKFFWDCPWWNRSPDLMRRIKDATAQAAAGEAFRAEMPYFVAGGGERMVDFILLPIKDESGRVTFLAPTGTDITDRKRAEESAHKQSEQLRQLAEVATRLNAADVASITGVVTEEARTLIGSHQAVTGLTIDQNWAQAINRVSLSEKYAAFRSYEAKPDGSGIYSLVCRTNKPVRMTQAELEKHPAYKWFGKYAADHPPLRGWLAAPLVGQDGRNIGLIQLSDKFEGEFTAEDEAILIQLAQMASVAIENARLVQDLRDADRRKDEFLATLAHELRNPLAPIRNGLQVLRLGGATGEMADNARTMMERQLGQMVHLIDDLLDLSRISRGKIELRKERVELAKVIQQAVETSRPLIESSGHDLTIAVPPGPVYVDADVTRLAQVFSNLLNNAAKYTERGGRVHLSVHRRGGEVVVSVKDNGVGIPAHMLPKVFEMFTQVDRHLERSQGGLGIGLSIVKSLVEMHGGSVGVESDGPGTGSEFTVQLPIVLSMAQPNDADEESCRPSNRRKVLVVDDNVDAAMSLAMMLKLMGNEAKTAHDGLEAMDVAAAYRPDLILLDIGMPRLNGHETAKRIREQPWGKGVVLVALTGWGQEDDRRKSDEAGFDSHMVKPIDPATLEKLLANLQADTA